MLNHISMVIAVIIHPKQRILYHKFLEIINHQQKTIMLNAVNQDQRLVLNYTLTHVHLHHTLVILTHVKNQLVVVVMPVLIRQLLDIFFKLVPNMRNYLFL